MFDSVKKLKSALGRDDESKEIAEMLAAKVIPPNTDYRSFDASLKASVTNLLILNAIPWFKACLTKYTEAEFHAKMASGFNFISDWKTNHPGRYKMFILGTKAVRNRFYWNSEAIVEGVVELLAREGWKVNQQEKAILWGTIEGVRSEIYS